MSSPGDTPRHNGAAIRAFRIKQGLKPGELAAMARLSYPHLDNIEHERRQPSIEVLHRIAAALEVPVRALLRDSATLTETSGLSA